MSRRRQGFTLIELLAAIAILAVVSVMAVQALGGIFMQRDVLTRIDRDAATLARALALLRADLEGAAPVPWIDEAGEPRPAITMSESGFTLSRAGFGADNGGTRIGRARWGLEPDGTLWRQVWPDQNTDTPPGPRVPVLAQVTELALTPLRGDLPTVQEPASLPPGLAVTLTHRRHGTLRVVVAR